MAGSSPEERARIAMLTQSALDFIAQVDPEPAHYCSSHFRFKPYAPIIIVSPDLNDVPCLDMIGFSDTNDILIIIVLLSSGSLVFSLFAGQNSELLHPNRGGARHSCGHLALHRVIGILYHPSFPTQTRPQFEYFRNKRLPRFLSSFERCLVWLRVHHLTSDLLCMLNSRRHFFVLGVRCDRCSIKAAMVFWSATNSGSKQTYICCSLSISLCLYSSSLFFFLRLICPIGCPVSPTSPYTTRSGPPSNSVQKPMPRSVIRLVRTCHDATNYGWF